MYSIIIVIIIIIVVIILTLLKTKKTNYEMIGTELKTNDISELNLTSVSKIFSPLNENELIEIVKDAHKNDKQISIRGKSHTMGGHTLNEGGYIIDMKFLNKIVDFDEKNMLVRVQTGTIWTDLIKFLNIYGLSPSILQSYSSFSIGGTLSVNAHGITSDYGLYESIIEFKMIDAEGNIKTCSRNENSELFSLVIGGYGLFGIVYEVLLKTVKNLKLHFKTNLINPTNFVDLYSKIVNDPSVDTKIARININTFDEIFMYSFTKKSDDKTVSDLDAKPKELSVVGQILYKWIFPSTKKLRYVIEKIKGSPLDIHSDDYERNLLLYESASSLAKLYEPIVSLNKTHILQEYFIPHDSFQPWMNFLKSVKNKFNNLLNITIRYLRKDETTFLKYATTDMFAYVFYFRIDKTEREVNKLKRLHIRLNEYALSLGGTFYLPYLHHYTPPQIFKAYPNIVEFIKLKYKYDPYEIFNNQWFQNLKRIFNISPNINPKIKFIQHQQVVASPPIIGHRFNNNFKKIFESSLYASKYKDYLESIFNVESHNDIYYFTKKICDKNDNDIYVELQNNFKSDLLRKYRLFKQINLFKKSLKNQMVKILGTQCVYRPFKGYLNFGDPGLLSKTLIDLLEIEEPIYQYYKDSQIEDILIRDSLLQKGSSVNKLENMYDSSVELITCFPGLHHFTLDEIDDILDNFHRILKPGGFLIIREHDGISEMIPYLNVIHDVFNALTNVEISKNREEIRNFQTLNTWKKWITDKGFINSDYYEMEDYDPTRDIMMCFKKPINPPTVLTIKNIRPQNQTYLVLPEWFLVDITQHYGKFMEHTPWYKYPYLQHIVLYWQLLYKSISKGGFNFSYVLMNMVIGIVFTLIFAQLLLLSLPLRIFYGLQPNETEKIELLIENTENINIKKIDKRIVNISDQIIEIPRYKVFTEIIVKLATYPIKIKNIAGQYKIQVKVEIKNDDDLKLLKLNKNHLYYYSFDTNKEYPIFQVLDIDVYILTDFIRLCLLNDIKILHVYDF